MTEINKGADGTIIIKMKTEEATSFLDEIYDMLEMTRPEDAGEDDEEEEPFVVSEEIFDKLSDLIGFTSPFMRGTGP